MRGSASICAGGLNPKPPDKSSFGYTSVIFVDLGVKVDGTYYCDLLLSQQLLPAVCHVSSEFIF